MVGHIVLYSGLGLVVVALVGTMTTRRYVLGESVSGVHWLLGAAYVVGGLATIVGLAIVAV